MADVKTTVVGTDESGINWSVCEEESVFSKDATSFRLLHGITCMIVVSYVTKEFREGVQGFLTELARYRLSRDR